LPFHCGPRAIVVFSQAASRFFLEVLHQVLLIGFPFLCVLFFGVGKLEEDRLLFFIPLFRGKLPICSRAGLFLFSNSLEAIELTVVSRHGNSALLEGLIFFCMSESHVSGLCLAR